MRSTAQDTSRRKDSDSALRSTSKAPRKMDEYRYTHTHPELELKLIQTQMTQKPMLRAEVYAHALRASQNRKENSA